MNSCSKCKNAIKRTGKAAQRANGSVLCEGCWKKDPAYMSEMETDNNKSVEANIQTYSFFHSELLYFIQNQLDGGTSVNDLSSLVNDFYSVEDCDKAKSLLVNLVKQITWSDQATTPPRQCDMMKNRIGPNKKKATILDIIKLLQEQAISDASPTIRFAAVYSHKIPPVSLNSIDVTALVRQVTLLRNEVAVIKDTCRSLSSNINTNSTCGLQPTTSKQWNEISSNDNADTIDNTVRDFFSDIRRPINNSIEPNPPTMANVVCRTLHHTGTDSSGAKSLSKPSEQNKWQKVTARKNNRKKVVKGTANSETLTLKATQPRAMTFVSRLVPDTDADGIKQHLLTSCNIDANVEKRQTRLPYYSSFLMHTSRNDQKTIMDANLWPEGALVKSFFAKKQSSNKITIKSKSNSAEGDDNDSNTSNERSKDGQT